MLEVGLPPALYIMEVEILLPKDTLNLTYITQVLTTTLTHGQ